MLSVTIRLKRLLRQKRILLKSLGAFAIIVATVMAAAPSLDAVVIAVDSTKKKLPIYSVETADKKVSISFDAAWGADDTDTILSILKEYDVRATFFLCGYWVEKYPEQVRKIYDAGHDIGNHGDTHAHCSQLNLDQTRQEIEGAHNKIKNLLGIEINLFRPPYGEYNNTVIDAADSLNYYTIQWDVETSTIILL